VSDTKIGLEAFIERYGSEAPEVVWQAALALLERTATGARVAAASRWSYYPQGELRRLRHELAGAMMLARLAVALQEEENSLDRELVTRARDVAEEQRQREKRAMTIEAERARLRLADRARQRSEEAS
jgi:hypothetical protein